VKPEPTEAEAARLNQLATELAASGADSKRRLPVVQERDAVMLTRALQEEIDGARFLDLFAGAGAVGLEAVGRGAARAVLVEGDPRTLRTLEENVGALGAEASTRLYRLRLPAGIAVLREREAPFALVFVDPPYGFAEGGKVLAALPPLLLPGGAVAYEHADRDAPPAAPDDLGFEETRCYGGSCLSFYRAGA